MNLGNNENIIKKEEYKLGKREFIKEEYNDRRYKKSKRRYNDDYNYRDRYRKRYDSFSSEENYHKKEYPVKKEYIEPNNNTNNDLIDYNFKDSNY